MENNSGNLRETKFDSGIFQLTMCKLVDINFIKQNAVDFWYGKIGGEENGIKTN